MAANNTQYPMYILSNGYVIKFEEATFFNDSNTYLEGVLYEEDGIGVIGGRRKKTYNPEIDDTSFYYEQLAQKVILDGQEDEDLPIPTNISETIPPKLAPPVSEPKVEQSIPESEGDIITYTYSTPIIKETIQKNGFIVKQIIINVNNNAGLPSYRHISAYNPQYNLTEETVLKDLKTTFSKDQQIRIIGKSYKNQYYPKEGTLKSLYNQDPISYVFQSQVVDTTKDRNNRYLKGVKIKDLDGKKTTTNSQGRFAIEGTYSPGKVQKLNISLKKYETIPFLPISTLNGEIRSDIPVIELIPDTKSSSSSLLKAQGNTEEQNEKLINLGKNKEEFIPITVKKIIKEVKDRLLPFIIKKLLCEPYGICDPIGLIETAKKAKDKAKDLNTKRKENKDKKEEEKKLAEEESINNENLT